ncbi:ferredoxin [Streptomyces mirabilis]|uniref:ferredoxin n=1 Tax=Streptomyces mirabilis TaxID=68239 RepID=UPI00367BEFC8
MKVVVDLSRCEGYAQRAFLAPEAFRMHGERALMYDPNPDDAWRDQVLRAAAACPVQAIPADRLDARHAPTEASP